MRTLDNIKNKMNRSCVFLMLTSNQIESCKMTKWVLLKYSKTGTWSFMRAATWQVFPPGAAHISRIRSPGRGPSTCPTTTEGRFCKTQIHNSLDVKICKLIPGDNKVNPFILRKAKGPKLIQMNNSQILLDTPVRTPGSAGRHRRRGSGKVAPPSEHQHL